MKRRSICLVVSITAVLGIVASAPTAAAADTRGTCTQSFSLVNAARWGAGGEAIDKNGNGWLCQKALPTEGDFNVTDDKL